MALDKQLDAAIMELRSAVGEIDKITRRRQVTEKALGLPMQGQRYSINIRGSDFKYFIMKDEELDVQSCIEELMARQVSLETDRW